MISLDRIEDGRPGWEQPDHLAGTGMETLLLQIVVSAGGPEAVTRRPVGPGASAVWTTPTDFADGVLVARTLRRHANQLMDTFVRGARGEGVDWADLAPALGVTEDDQHSAAERAFHAYQDLHGEHVGRRVIWTCASCRRSVTDNGPYSHHPDDREEGHADTCTRHLAAVRAWQDEQDAEDARHDDDPEDDPTQAVMVPGSGSGDGGGSLPHRVNPGETLSELATRFGTTVDALVALNGITDRNPIRAGDWISIPDGDADTDDTGSEHAAAEPPTPPAPPVIHLDDRR